MMERMHSNILADGDPFLADDDKIDFDRNDFKNIMDSTELDKALSEDANWGDFNFDDADIEKMVNPDDLNFEGLEGSDGSFDGLANMPIVEVDEDQVEQLLGNIAKEENISVPLSSTYPSHTMQLEADDSMFEAQPDPLLGRLSRRGSAMYGASPSTQPPFVMQDMAQEVDALQRMVDDAVMQAIPRTAPQQERQVPLNNQPAIIDLEQEKLRLLSRLNEINHRQHMTSTTADSFLSSGAMSQMSAQLMRQQQHQQEPPKAAVASIGTMNHAGETPLTSFLRKNQKTQPMAATTARVASVNLPGAASIFAESPMSFDNPLLRGSHTKQNTLFGAMDRTTASQEMVRKLSARSLLARSDSGQNIRGGFAPQEMHGGNQTWGDSTGNQRPTMSFKTSGILPRHASDNHVLRAGTKGSLIRSRSKNTSLSRENLLYMKKTTNSEDSLGSLLPVKRAGGTKHKVGISRSTPRLNISGPHSGHGGSQMNAMW